jgi:hypothetical protein
MYPDFCNVGVLVKPGGKSATYKITRSNACGNISTYHTFVGNGPCAIVPDPERMNTSINSGLEEKNNT